MSRDKASVQQDLLQLIDQDCTQSPENLGQQLGIGSGEVKAMLKELTDEKIIVKQRAIINWEKAGVDTVTAIIEVRITPQREVGFDAIAERICRFPEVRNLYLLSGSYDLAVMVEGSTLKEVAQFVSTKLATIDGVLSTTTHFVLKKYKEEGVLIEDEETDHRLLVSP